MQQISLDIQLAPWPAPVPNPLLLCAGDRIVPFGPGAPDVSKASGQGFGARADRGSLRKGKGKTSPWWKERDLSGPPETLEGEPTCGRRAAGMETRGRLGVLRR